MATLSTLRYCQTFRERQIELDLEFTTIVITRRGYLAHFRSRRLVIVRVCERRAVSIYVDLALCTRFLSLAVVGRQKSLFIASIHNGRKQKALRPDLP